MIIKSLMLLLKNILSLALNITLPSLPGAVTTGLTAVITYIVGGLSMLTAFVGLGTVQYMIASLSIIIVIETFMRSWQFIWWVLSKIPMFGISG